MPVSESNLTTLAQWTLDRPNPGGFQDTIEGPDSVQFSLGALNLTTFDQLYASTFLLTAGSAQTIDFSTFTNLVSEATGFAHFLSMFVVTSGGPVTITNSASNPLSFGLSGTSAGFTVQTNGMMAFSQQVTGPGFAVTSGAKNITFTNNDLVLSTSVTVVALGGTT